MIINSKWKLLFLSLCLLLSTSAYVLADDCTFNVQFDNPTDKKVEYLFYWIDHPFKQATPANMAGGELQPGESHQLEYKYKCGEYFVRWDLGDSTYNYAFSHRNNNPRILTPGD